MKELINQLTELNDRDFQKAIEALQKEKEKRDSIKTSIVVLNIIEQFQELERMNVRIRFGDDLQTVRPGALQMEVVGMELPSGSTLKVLEIN